jgi:hypothetical protein
MSVKDRSKSVRDIRLVSALNNVSGSIEEIKNKECQAFEKINEGLSSFQYQDDPFSIHITSRERLNNIQKSSTSYKDLKDGVIIDTDENMPHYKSEYELALQHFQDDKSDQISKLQVSFK